MSWWRWGFHPSSGVAVSGLACRALCVHGGVAFWLVADISFIPCPGCFPAARAAAWLPVEDEFFDCPQLEMAQGAPG